jgi:RND family efflux transporter MFP subunit
MMGFRQWMTGAFAALLVVSAVPAAVASDTDAIVTQPVTRVELPRIYRLDGIAEAINRSTVSAQTSGQVLEVRFDVDDYVRAGDVIVRIDDSEQTAGVAQAEANLRAAQARRQDARQEFERIRGVFERQAVSQAEMDRATTALQQARAAVESADATLRQARQQLAYTEVTAPYNGIVIERAVEVGEVVQPGRPLMTGLSLDQMRVSVDVPQNLVPAVRRERQAQAQIGDRWIEAERVTVFPVADPRSDTFQVRLGLPDGLDDVFPGMYVKVGFVLGTQADLVIPLSAVVLRSEVVGVYVVGADGRVFFRQIRLGSPAGPEHVTVLSGLVEGEQVATNPVAAGIRLKAQRQSTASGG